MTGHEHHGCLRYACMRDVHAAYSPTRATGLELADLKAGIYKRTKPGDDDDAY